jgi:hypothetical protein
MQVNSGRILLSPSSVLPPPCVERLITEGLRQVKSGSIGKASRSGARKTKEMTLDSTQKALRIMADHSSKKDLNNHGNPYTLPEPGHQQGKHFSQKSLCADRDRLRTLPSDDLNNEESLISRELEQGRLKYATREASWKVPPFKSDAIPDVDYFIPKDATGRLLQPGPSDIIPIKEIRNKYFPVIKKGTRNPHYLSHPRHVIEKAQKFYIHHDSV